MPQEIIVDPQTGLPAPSRSMLEASECGLRYKRLYVEGMQDESAYSLRGTAFHEVHFQYIKALAAASLPMDLDLAEAAFEKGIAICHTPPQIIPEVYGIWRRHVEHFDLDLDKYHSAERHRVRLDVAVPYQYKPDLEYVHADKDEIETFDWKSYHVAFTEAQAAELFQTIYYVWAAMQEFPGYKTYRMTYVFVRLNRTVSVVYDAASFADLDAQVRASEAARRERHRTNDFAPCPGEVCRFCQLSCPVMDDERRAFVRVNSKESFQTVAGSLIVFEKTVKLMKKALKAYATSEGEQNVGGEIFRQRQVIQKRYPAKQVIDHIQALGDEATFTVSASTLKALEKRIPGLAEDLEPLALVKETARFEHRSLKYMAEASADEDEE